MSTTSSTLDATEIILKAYNDGRPIVPFLGSGISAGAGFPTMSSVTDYLAKYRYYSLLVNDSSITQFAEEHNWHDIHRLNADVWRHLAKADGNSALSKLIKRIADRCDDTQSETFQQTLHAAAAKVWRHPNRRPTFAVQAMHLDMLSASDQRHAKAIAKFVCGGKITLRGDWYDLLIELTDGNFGLIDSLFSMFSNQRTPSSVHQLLAQLVDAFRIRLFLSLNFDRLLETALWEEGHDPTVMEVARDSGLPPPEVVGNRLLVLKLHGGHFGVRIGEKINEAADPNTVDHFFGILPRNALVLVMGFSGEERRMMQLLEEHRSRALSPDPAILWMNFSRNIDVAVKQKFLGSDGEPVKGFSVHPYTDALAFLFSILARLRHSHSAGRKAYRMLPTSPWKLQDEIPDPSNDIDKDPRPIRAYVRKHEHFKCTTAWPQADSAATLAMAAFCDSKAKTHRIIWIDGDEHHTVEGVVSDIIEQVRRFDPTFPPLLMQASSSSNKSPEAQNAALDRAVDRIRESLQRGPYILCIDSPDAIGRLQTVHHGTPTLRKHNSEEIDGNLLDHFKTRVNEFFLFLHKLLLETIEARNPKDIGESFICVSFALPIPRHARNNNADTIRFVRGKLNDIFAMASGTDDQPSMLDLRIRVEPAPIPVAKPNWNKAIDKLLDILIEGVNIGRDLVKTDRLRSLLAIYRRPRSHLALKALISHPEKRQDQSIDLPGSSRPLKHFNHVDMLKLLGLDTKTSASPSADKNSVFIHLSGGLIWMRREANAADYEALADLGTHSPKSTLRLKSLLALSLLHKRALRYYFSEVYEATGDIRAFREYIYHRVSCLKYFAELLTINKSQAKHNPRLANWFTTFVGLQSIGDSRTNGDYESDLLQILIDDMRAFRAALSREFSSVKRHLYAGSWLNLIETVRAIDLARISSTIKHILPDGGNLKRKVEYELKELKDELQNQESDLLFQKADWDGLSRHARKRIAEFNRRVARQFKWLIPDSNVKNRYPENVGADESLTVGDKKSLAGLIDEVLAWIEITRLYGILARCQHETLVPGLHDRKAEVDLDEAMESLLLRLRGWFDWIEEKSLTSEQPYISDATRRLVEDKLNSVTLDWKADKARFLLRKCNPWWDDEAHKRNCGMRTFSSENNGRIDEARSAAQLLWEKARVMVLGKNGQYNRLRAIALRILARCDYLVAKTPEDFQRPIADLNLAIRLLHGVGFDDSLEMVACHRSKGEALMLMADMAIRLDNDRIAYARERMRTANGMLLRARAALAIKDVSWWTRLCRDFAQWSIQSCCLGILEWFPKGPSPDESQRSRIKRAFEDDLRRGLDAIRAGLDSLIDVSAVLGRSEDATKACWKAFVAQWLMLGLVHRWLHKEIDRSLIRTPAFTNERETNETSRPSINDLWEEVCDSARINRLVKLVRDIPEFGEFSDISLEVDFRNGFDEAIELAKNIACKMLGKHEAEEREHGARQS
jgi:hypothetical protein